MTGTNPLPDPHRIGGPGWARSTGACLTGADRRRMALISLDTQRRLLVSRIGRRTPVSVDLSEVLTLPDSRLVREAEEAALVQPPALLAHGYRTAAFARALALIDGVAVDQELLAVCGLLHDTGLVPAVTGEDFTLRSAAIAVDTATKADRADAAPLLEDAVVVHTTIGITPEQDGALGTYLQWGAMVDLTGLRERELPRDLVARALANHPREGFAREIISALGAEARAVPCGRFAFLRRVGFSTAVRMARLPSRP